MRIYVSFFISVLLAASLVHADTSPLTPTSCDQLYNLPQGTITTSASSQYLNSATCSAYQYLIARYSPGNCSNVGFSNAQVQGITSLNSDFAQRLSNMLQAASAAGFNITINSAFRTVAGEKCANPGGFGGDSSASMHTKGLAADLQFPNDSNSAKGCDTGSGSAGYQWVLANAKTYGLGLYDQLHSHVNGECNHVEAATAVAGGIGPGGGGSTQVAQTPTSGITNAVQSFFNPQPTPQPAPLSPLPLQTTPSITPTPLPTGSACAPQYYCSNNTVYYESSSCSTQIFQACSYGCAGTICAAGPTSSTSILTSANPITVDTTQSILSQLLAPSTTTGTTSTPLALNSNLFTVVQVLASSQPTTSSSASLGQGDQVYASQTFTSGNLSSGGYSPQSYTPLQQLLATLQSALVGFLTYLQPFGGQSQGSVSAE